MQLLAITNLPIYLPYDKAQLPAGDPIPGVTATAAAPGVFTFADTYTPANGDAIALTFAVGGSLPAPLTVTPNGTTTFGNPGTALAIYYAVGASGQTCNLAATKGGAAITTTTTGSLITAHLMSGQVDGVTLPFKPGYTVLVENNSGGTLVLQGAPDTGQGAPGTNTYNPPAGPGTFVTLATLTAGAQTLVNLSFDWIRVSTAGTLFLQQN
jgi:hypothetical protein